MNVIKFLAENWDSVIVVLIALAAIVCLIVKKQYGILDKIVFALVTEAEKIRRRYGCGKTCGSH